MKWLRDLCKEDGTKYCSCWFDLWYGKTACKEHDDDYLVPLGKSKLECDLKLWWNVTTANKWLCIPGFVIGMVMFVGLTVSPKSYEYWRMYRGN